MAEYCLAFSTQEGTCLRDNSRCCDEDPVASSNTPHRHKQDPDALGCSEEVHHSGSMQLQVHTCEALKSYT